VGGCNRRCCDKVGFLATDRWAGGDTLDSSVINTNDDHSFFKKENKNREEEEDNNEGEDEEDENNEDDANEDDEESELDLPKSNLPRSQHRWSNDSLATSLTYICRNDTVYLPG
jgi:hypothetical protein